MYKDGNFNFKFVGQFDISKLKEKVLSLTDADWDEYKKRQDRQSEMYKNIRSPHEGTKTIPLLFNEKFGDFPDKWGFYSLFEEEINQIKDYLHNYYGKGNSPRIILANLLAERNILPHVDTGEQLLKCKRHHIPIVTNPLVMFNVGDEKINMIEGDVWEINNANQHYVQNFSDKDRIHIIVDWDLNLEY
jgi:hypothetical protein